MAKTPTNLVKQLQEEFAPIGSRWEELKRDTGAFFTKAKTLCSESQFKFLQQWVKKHHRITLAQQLVCMRIHNENIPDIVVEKIPPSTLQKIAPQNIPDPNKEYDIISPDDGGPVRKCFKDMTVAEVRVNIGPHGIRDLRDGDAEITKPLVSCRATHYRVEDKELVIFVRSLNKEVRLQITDKLKDDVAKAKSRAA